MEAPKFYKIAESEAKLRNDLPWTPPFDPRFPNTNQKRNCYQNFVDFHRCEKKLGEGNKTCQYFKNVYSALCPEDWVAQWDTQLSENRFPGKI